MAGLNGVNFPVKGTFAAMPTGGTIETSEAATTSTLSTGGNPFGIFQVLTTHGSGARGNPLVTTGAPTSQSRPRSEIEDIAHESLTGDLGP